MCFIIFVYAKKIVLLRNKTYKKCVTLQIIVMFWSKQIYSYNITWIQIN